MDLKELQAKFEPLILPAVVGGALAYHWKGKSYPAAALGAVAGALVGSMLKKKPAPTPVQAALPAPVIDPDRARLVRSEADRGHVQLHEVATLPRALQLRMTDEAWARYWERRLVRHPEDEATMRAIAEERGRRWVAQQQEEA